MKYLHLFEEWARTKPNNSIRKLITGEPYSMVAGKRGISSGSNPIGLEDDSSHSKMTPEQFQQAIADAMRTKSPLDAFRSLKKIWSTNPHLKHNPPSVGALGAVIRSLTKDELEISKNEADEWREIESHFRILHDHSSSDEKKQKALDFFLARIGDKSLILLDYLHDRPSEAGKLLAFLPAEYHSQLEDFYGMESKEIRAVDLAAEFGII